jgi:CLIP-associating protein 1/2
VQKYSQVTCDADNSHSMFDTLEKREKTALEKDPNNPNTSSLASSQAPVPSFSKSVGAGAARNALKEKIAEQRRVKAAAAAKGVPERPMSAAATYTPAKSVSSKSLGSRTAAHVTNASSGPARPPSAMSGESTKSALKNSMGSSTGSLMSGTVRRPTRPRPELTRPATADPYAVRRAGNGKVTPSMTPEKTPAVTTTKKSVAPKSSVRPRAQTQNSPNVSPVRSKSRLGQSATAHKTANTSSRQNSPAPAREEELELTIVKPFVRSQSHHDAGTIPFRQRNGLGGTAVVDNDPIDDEDNFTMVIPNLARPTAQSTHHTPPKSTASPGRLAAPSPRGSALRSPKSMGDINGFGFRSSVNSPRQRSPDRPSTRGTDAQEEVQVFEDPFVGDEPTTVEKEAEKPVLGELPINEKNIERRPSNESIESDTVMGNASEDRPRGHHKTTSTGSVLYAESNDTKDETNKNKQLLASGIKRIEGRTVDAQMFRKMQEIIRSNQEIWGANDETFGRLLLASLDFLETPAEALKKSPMQVANLKVQALATIRTMLSLYRKETAKYFSRVLRAILQTKAHYENTSHIAVDLETTADEIVRYGQTLDCLNTVLALIEDSPASTPTSSPNSKSSVASLPGAGSTRTITMALSTLASLIQISGAKNVSLSSEQTSRLGKLAVRCMDDQDADVRKANIEFCIALHERIAAPAGEQENDGFWRAVAGAREQHLNLLTYYLAKRNKA